MLISADGNIQNHDRSEMLTSKRVKYFWVGFLYSPGRKAGEETVRFISEYFEETGSVPFDQLRGSFSLYIVSENKILAFADNSDLSTVFVHPDKISDRFVPLIQSLGKGDSELKLDAEAVAQTYAIGRILSGRTLIDSITMLDKRHFVEVCDGEIRTRDKGVPDIDIETDNFNPSVFFDALAYALPDSGTSCALTGGYDSRLVYSSLNNRMSVQPSLSGDIPTTSEARVSSEVATASGAQLNFVNTPRPTIDEELIDKLFLEQDGAPGFCSDSGIRLFGFYEGLRSQGFETHITGDGGVLHKDWEWIQDFPFYHRKNTNLGRFYDHRLGFNSDHKGAGPVIKTILQTMRKDTLVGLRQHLQRTNSQSYDMLYYHVNGRRTVHYNSSPHGVRLYAPLLERDFVAYSYGLPRFQRFFNNSIRSMTTAEQARLARIPTVYGMTASCEFRYICRDILFQLVDYGRRATRLLGRKLLGRTPLMEPVISWTAEDDLRALPLASEAVEYCQEVGLVSSTESVSTLSRQHIDVSIQIFLVSRTARLVKPV